MYSHNMLLLTVKAFLPLIKKMISEVKLNHLRFDVGTNGIFIYYKPDENEKPFKLEIPFEFLNLPEQT